MSVSLYFQCVRPSSPRLACNPKSNQTRCPSSPPPASTSLPLSVCCRNRIQHVTFLLHLRQVCRPCVLALRLYVFPAFVFYLCLRSHMSLALSTPSMYVVPGLHQEIVKSLKSS